MKKLILTALSICFITISTHAYSMDNMSGNSSQTMGTPMNMTEKDVYPNLSAQDKVIYDKLDAQQKAFVLRMINTSPQMHKKTMNGQGQMQQDRGMNPDMQQEDHIMKKQH